MNIRGDHDRPKVYRHRVHFDHKKREIRIEEKMRKISRKRFIGLAMYRGFSAREAREMADVVLVHGASYQQGYRLLMKAIIKALAKAEAKAKNEELDKLVNADTEES